MRDRTCALPTKGSPRSQPDEALYRATAKGTPAPDAVRLLTIAAEDLRNHSPSGVFAEADRLAVARHLTTGTAHAPTALLAHMPRLDRQTTRGEYALILADTAKGVARRG